jgi:Ala-tRNA(Pro) deacylase
MGTHRAADRQSRGSTDRDYEEEFMPQLIKLREFLDANHIAYQVLTHPTAFTAQELAAVEHVHGREHAKVVILRHGSGCLMVVLPAPYHVDLEKARAATGRRDLEVAKEHDFISLFPDCSPGAMPPFGNLYNMEVWVDQSLTTDEEIVFNAGSHTQSIRMKYADFARVVRPKVAVLRVEH